MAARTTRRDRIDRDPHTVGYARHNIGETLSPDLHAENPNARGSREAAGFAR